MLNYIKRKLNIGNKEVPKSEQFFTPLRIALHSTISIQTVDWLIIQQNLNGSFKLPHGFSQLAKWTRLMIRYIAYILKMKHQPNIVCSFSVRKVELEAKKYWNLRCISK